MIVLDTNVVSELMKPREIRSEQVVAWAGAQDARELCVASMTYAEILAGIEVLPAGKRRSDLLSQAIAVVEHDLAGRVLAFDKDAARVFARLSAERRRAGRRSSKPDLLIAATAISRNLAVATRDVEGFDHVGLTIINPWDHSAA